MRWPLDVTIAPRVGPRELKLLMTSLLRAVVSFMCDEPTVITDGSCPGEPMVPNISEPLLAWPKLPPATTTTMPAAVALRAARASGSVCQDSVEPAARLRFITRML